MASTNSVAVDSRPVFFFDIDNCLYSRKCNIHDLMQELIDKFFIAHLPISAQDAVMLHQKYYKEYGLAIEGLTKHHKIDPLEFNKEVDDALPLDDILKPDPKLRKLLEDMDKSKVKMWLLTNAYVNHAKRVVKLLGVEDLFEGVTYCDYGSQPLICKPNQKMYEKAEQDAGAPSTEQCYFVDDSALNCEHSQARGWTTVHLVEPGFALPEVPPSKYTVRSLEELRGLFPQFFKSSDEKSAS
ncbi:hypothetical protein DTO271D3_1634 [Paecilomyces variotii]|nr:hypothetical protein DTO169C6_4122 [Paecilomyces variotii]KAJ9246061.1 hypothetical protein DTO169E5_185 [Paecilomyces variotii]KAJ9259123.1 hypothetical protein DTO207G8_1283 [Paecilomyces variotii]KAJ9318377.1 hypothetical protein DTO271D3_1634 [Paecilomyces variotii]KAJ9383430.1 hypothetical protein DTO063F5_5266 [Paecilomyces variotii]